MSTICDESSALGVSGVAVVEIGTAITCLSPAISGEVTVALVVLLRGVNVGGHRTLRPSTLDRQLEHLDAVNIGAAGTLVIRRPVSRAQLRDEISRRLRFDAEIVICAASDIVRLIAADVFSGFRFGNDAVRFVSVLSRTPRLAPSLPLTIASRGKWLVRNPGAARAACCGRLPARYEDHRLSACPRPRVWRTRYDAWNTVTAIATKADEASPRATSTKASPRRTNT